MRKRFLSSAGIVLCLALIGCTAGTLVNTLNLIVDAAEVALPLLTTLAGVPASITTPALAWLSAVTTVVPEVTAELASTDSSVVKAQKITADFQSVINGPAFTGSVPPRVAAIVQTVTAAISVFLSELAQTSTTPLATAAQPYRLTAGDRHVLSGIVSRANSLHAKIEAARAK